MRLLLSLLGAALVLVAVRDVFDTLFHPSGRGVLSQVITGAVWRGFRRVATRRRAALELAGPVALLVVIASWGMLLAVGWALIFWPHLPGAFLFSPGLSPSAQGSFVDALYLSLVTLATLGYGDITPASGWLRVLAPLEALFGFALLTASLTWVISVYSTLSQMRSLAHEVTLVREAHSETGIDLGQVEASAAERTLSDLAAQLVAVESQLAQFPVAYYFHSSDERMELSAAVPDLLHLAETGGVSHSPGVRVSARMLRGAIDDFSAVLGSRFLGLPAAKTEKILAAFARDNLRAPPDGSDSTPGDHAPE